jgi:hypothetical protein
MFTTTFDGDRSMIHYHGLPITPTTVATVAIGGGHAFVSFSHTRQLGLAAEYCQSFALDNGAYSAWTAGNPITRWDPYYRWAEECRALPNCDFAVIPDVIGGSEDENDRLVAEWPLPSWFGAPVWHMIESLERLDRLVASWPRVCISPSNFDRVGSPWWWARMNEAMQVACDSSGRPRTKLHGLKLLDPRIFSRIPLASADSTNIGRNVGIDSHWHGRYTPPNKEARASVMRHRIEAYNAPSTWQFFHQDVTGERQLELFTDDAAGSCNQ